MIRFIIATTRPKARVGAEPCSAAPGELQGAGVGSGGGGGGRSQSAAHPPASTQGLQPVQTHLGRTD